MELQIQDLVSSIKKEGIDEAKKEAASIIAQAEKKAEEIVNAAKDQAAATVKDAEKEVNLLREIAQLSAQQALRDASITFEKEIQDKFKKILAVQVSQQLSSEAIVKLALAAIGNDNPGNFELEIAEVSEGLKAGLAAEINNGLEIKVGKIAKKGFRLACKDGSGFFDLTEDELVQMISSFMGDIQI